MLVLSKVPRYRTKARHDEQHSLYRTSKLIVGYAGAKKRINLEEKMKQPAAASVVLGERKLKEEEVDRLAERIYGDERNAHMGRPLSEEQPQMTVADAYAV